MAETGDIVLKGIPQNNFTEPELLTFSSEADQKRYIVIQPPDAPTAAYTSLRIKRNLLSYDLTILRSQSTNPGELVPPEVM